MIIKSTDTKRHYVTVDKIEQLMECKIRTNISDHLQFNLRDAIREQTHGVMERVTVEMRGYIHAQFDVFNPVIARL